MLKRSRINRYSLKKIAELNAEYPVRLQLIQRCQGIAHPYEEITYNNGRRYIIHRVSCFGGYCECGRPECNHRWAVEPERLHPHEKVFRSHGGILSLENTIMVLDHCHEILQNNKPRWSGSGQLGQTRKIAEGAKHE